MADRSSNILRRDVELRSIEFSNERNQSIDILLPASQIQSLANTPRQQRQSVITSGNLMQIPQQPNQNQEQEIEDGISSNDIINNPHPRHRISDSIDDGIPDDDEIYRRNMVEDSNPMPVRSQIYQIRHESRNLQELAR